MEKKDLRIDYSIGNNIEDFKPIERECWLLRIFDDSWDAMRIVGFGKVFEKTNPNNEYERSICWLPVFLDNAGYLEAYDKAISFNHKQHLSDDVILYEKPTQQIADEINLWIKRGSDVECFNAPHGDLTGIKNELKNNKRQS